MHSCASPRLLFLFILLSSVLGLSQNASPPSTTQKPEAATGTAPATPASGLSPNSPAGPEKTDNAQESVIFDRDVLKMVFEADGTNTRELELKIRIQAQAGVQELGILRFPYLSSNENVDFDYVRVRKPDGTVINTPDYNIQDMPAEVTRIAPMYSDLHEKHVTVKALGVGDVLEYKLRYRTFKPIVAGQFGWSHSFDKNFIALDNEIEVTVPKDKYLNLSSPNYKPEVKEDGAHRIYAWKTSNLKHKDPDEAVSRDSQKPDIQFSTFRSWQEVGAWYNDLQRPQLTVTPQIRAKVAELTKGLTSNDDKTRAIYDYVSTGLHYVSLSFGVGRYQPHPAEDVLENQYGDCKDKHTLLATMLKAAGIEAWPALINSDGKLDDSMPSPRQFDHVITYVPRAAAPLWLDTTPGAAPFNMLMGNLRNKQALVVPVDKPAELKTTPANPPFPANQTFTMEGAIDKDGTLKAHVRTTYRGDYEVYFRLAFRNTAAAQWKELMQRISNSARFSGEVSNVTASSPEDTTKPFEVSYDYTRKKFSDGEDRHMSAPLPLMGLEGAAAQEKKPVDPVPLGALGEVLYTAKITQPDAVVDKMQNNVSLDEPYADYESSYLFSSNQWTTTRRLKIKQNEVPLASWDNYKKFSKALSDDESTYTVTLAAGAEKNAAAQAAGSGGSTDTVPEELQTKWDEAGEALHRNDLTTAEDILQELLKKYGDQRGLHAGLGEVYAQRNQRESALKEFAKEEQLFPDNLGVYRVVATYYLWLHRDDSAAEQYRKWIELAPKNYDAYAGLSAVLNRQKKYPEVLQLWLGAAQQLPDKKQVKTALAYAYLHNKQPEKAAPLLEQGLDAESKPMEYNSASYELADANIDLPKAKEWGSRALDSLYRESLDITTEDAALSNTANIAATWDTVGWVSYKMGDYAKAEAYLESAFTLSQDAVEGDHLAQTYQKQGKKEQAEHTYKLAYAQAKDPLRDEIKERYQQLMGKNADPEDSPVHLKRGAGSNDYGAEDQLSKMRTTKISAKPVASGSATFTIAFTPDKIGDVKFVSGDEKLKPMATQIASSKLRAEFPDVIPARLTRRGVLMCGSTGCDFTLLLPSDVYNTENMPPSK